MAESPARLEDRIMEGAWLFALAAIPVFFNPQSVRVFDGDKAGLLRALALILAACLAVRFVGWPGGIPLLRLTLVRPAIIWTAAIVAATAASVVPHLSLSGSYHRAQGLTTWLCYLAVFLAIALFVRRPRQIDRIVDALLLAGLGAAFYAIAQFAGYDPLAWRAEFGSRVGGTFGNPIFLGGFLILVIPLAFSRLLGRWRFLRSYTAASDPRERRAAAAILAAYALLLLVQMAALVLCGSRGPNAGLATGAAFVLLILMLRSGRRRLIQAVAVTTALIVLAAGIGAIRGVNQESLRRADRQGIPLSSQLGRLGTIRVRLLVWEGASRLLAARPERWPSGYGPETIYDTFSAFYPPGLGSVERRGDSADRCHNETFDTLLTTGIAGLAAEVAFFLALLVLLMTRLGLASTRKDRAAIATGGVVGAAIGWTAPLLVLGSAQLSGIGLPAGLLAGAAGWICVRAGWERRVEPARSTERDGLVLALLAAAVAHFAEIQFGIATVTSRLCYWTFAALAVALCHLGAEASGPPATPPSGSKAKGKRGGPPGRIHHAAQPGAIHGLLVGLLLCLFTFGLSDPSTLLSAGMLAQLLLCLAVWTVGLALALDALITGTSGPARVSPLAGRYALASLGPWLGYSAVHLWWMSYKPDTERITAEILREGVLHLANGVTLVYVLVFLLLALMVRHLRDGPPAQADAAPMPWWRTPLLALLLAAGGFAAKATSLDASRADVLAKQASGYEEMRQWDAALVVRSETLRLRRDDPQYRREMGVALMSKAGGARDPAVFTPLLEQAQSLLAGLWEENRSSYQNAWNLAKLHRRRSLMAPDAGGRRSHGLEAERFYRTTADLFPSNTAVLDDWAAYALEKGEPGRALELLQRSLGIDQRFAGTYALRAAAHMRMKSYALAIADYERALALDPKSAEARQGLSAARKALAEGE